LAIEKYMQMSRETIYQQEALAARRFGYCLAGLTAAAVLSVLLACMFGRLSIPLSTVVQVFLAKMGLVPSGSLNHTWQEVVWQIRLSRVCLSLLVGMSLAVAGTAFQGILRNPLADPFTLGVSTGAACGASLAIFMGLAAKTAFGMGLLPLAALAGAMAALAAVMALGRINGRLRRDTMILAGIVVATFLSALISLLKSLDEESVSSIVFWVMGSFQGRGWSQVLFALPYIAAGLIIVGFNARELDLLALGEMQARQMGVEVDQARRRLLIGASLLTAGAVSVSGIIGFVGLVVPHLLRMLIGAEHRPLLILAAILGGLALLWSDVLARVILPGGEELPVGVVTAILGGPFFCLLLKKRREGEIL
jgi:iron complex transport system permease protein